MAFRPIESVKSSIDDVNQIIQALNGTAGKGQPISLTALESSSEYALDVRNNDSVAGLVARFRSAAGVEVLRVRGSEVRVGVPLASTVAQGSAPISVSSTTLCPKLNAEFVGGKSAVDLGAISIYSACGRLTLSSATPVTTSDVTAATTLYYTPFEGDKVALYDGDRWRLHILTERTLDISGLFADKNYDIFMYDNAGTLTLEAVAWADHTARATALSHQNRILVKSGAAERRYLGTIRTTPTAGQCEDSKACRFVWNEYNRRRRVLWCTDGTDSWTYNTDTWRAANAQTDLGKGRVGLVIGRIEDPVHAVNRCPVRMTDSACRAAVGIGVDCSDANHAAVVDPLVVSGVAHAEYLGYPGLGYRYLARVERSLSDGLTTFFGDAGLGWASSGLQGEVLG